jgi:hypothetical protein
MSVNLATAMQSSTMGTDPNMRNRPTLVPNGLKTCTTSLSRHNQLKQVVGSSFVASTNAVQAGKIVTYWHIPFVL